MFIFPTYNWYWSKTYNKLSIIDDQQKITTKAAAYKILELVELGTELVESEFWKRGQKLGSRDWYNQTQILSSDQSGRIGTQNRLNQSGTQQNWKWKRCNRGLEAGGTELVITNSAVVRLIEQYKRDIFFMTSQK